MGDQPEPSEREQEGVPEHQPEEEAMSAAGYADPDLPAEPPEDPIHEA